MAEETYKDTVDKVFNVLCNNGLDVDSANKALKEIGDLGVVFRESVDEDNWITALKRKGLSERDIYWRICDKFQVALPLEEMFP
jgi:rhodanese-related sulfurtransferase